MIFLKKNYCWDYYCLICFANWKILRTPFVSSQYFVFSFICPCNCKYSKIIQKFQIYVNFMYDIIWNIDLKNVSFDVTLTPLTGRHLEAQMRCVNVALKTCKSKIRSTTFDFRIEVAQKIGITMTFSFL